ncbi:MAG: hypothetical protein M1825_003351 [Sarcosagium campestre]|nr:MAG: hypothetical protein M1825_003351 [Sarcosagium campestre]
MNPHQKNKIDISSLSADEQRVFRLYGKLPNKTDLLQNKLKERKYFDSGDYALSKAGKASDAGVTQIGREHPLPENIPHLTSPGAGNGNGNGNHANGVVSPNGLPGSLATNIGGISTQSGSPVKESSFLHRETSIDDQSDDGENAVGRPENKNDEGSISPPAVKGGVPIRWQT